MTVSKSSPLLHPLVFPWLVALGLHGGLLAIPVPQAAPPVVKKAINTVPLARTIPAPATTQPPVARIKSTAVIAATAAPLVAPSSVQTQAPPPSPIASEPQPIPPKPTEPQPTEPQPIEPQPIEPQLIEPQPTNPKSIAPQPPPSGPEPILGNISQILGAEPSCQGNPGCWQVGETQWRKVAETIEQQLHNKGYSLTQLELEDETGLGVYEVLKQGKREFYLHVIQIEQKTVYVLKPQLLGRRELEQAAFEG